MDWLYFYQHLPFYINPTAIKIGFFSVSWYSIMYVVAFMVVYFLVQYRIGKNEWEGEIETQNSKLETADKNSKLSNFLLDFLAYAFLGLVIGARLGEVLFYNFSYYAMSPIRIISPFDPITHEFIGIYGMSYHGGLIGVLLAVIYFCRKNRVNFWQLADFVVPAVPAGYFFGRIGNFINGELYGRASGKFWGMYFPLDSYLLLRHPSQLYEAFFEGLVLFLILWKIRNHEKIQGKMLAVYILGYAFWRFFMEFFREPDEQISLVLGFLTRGQILSILMMILGIFLYWKKRKTLV